MPAFALPYNPNIFEKDKRYLDKRNMADIVKFQAKRYSRNKEKLEVLREGTTAALITVGANIYSKDIQYPEWKDEKWIKRRKSAWSKAEKYRRLNNVAAIWKYAINGEWYFKAYQASEFVRGMNDFGKFDYCMIRTGQFLKILGNETSETWYYFKLFRDGKVYQCTAKDWDQIPQTDGEYNELSTTGWELDEDNPTYTVLPINFIGENGMPSRSPFPYYEDVLSGGVAFGELMQQREFMNLLVGNTDLSQAQWEDLMKQMSAFKAPNIPPSDNPNQSGSPLNVVNLGDGEVQEKWNSNINKSLKRLCYSEGIDATGFFEELKVMTGTSRRVSLDYVVTYRDNAIEEFIEWEMQDMQDMVEMGIVSQVSDIIYSDLDFGETDSEKEDAETKRLNNIITRRDRGAITKAQMISEMEKITIEEAKARMVEVDNENAGVQDFKEGQNDEQENQEEER